MKYCLSDVYDSLEIAFDIKKVLFQFIGILLALTGLFLLLWAGGLAGNPLVSMSAEILGIIFYYLVVVSVAGGITFISYKELTSGEKISIKDSLLFVKNNWFPITVSPLLLLIAASVVFLAEYVIFMLGRLAAGQIVLSILSAPIILLNAAVILFTVLGIFIMFSIIVSEGTGTIATLNKTYVTLKKAYLKLLMALAPTLIIGSLVLIALFMSLAAGIVISLSIFGSSSGLFMELAAIEVPTLSTSMQAAWMIFAGFAALLISLLGSYKLVFLKTAAVSIYLKVKEDLK